jgi:hypothetical protein
MVIWYIFPRFGMLYHEKSGNLAEVGDLTTILAQFFDNRNFTILQIKNFYNRNIIILQNLQFLQPKFYNFTILQNLTIFYSRNFTILQSYKNLQFFYNRNFTILQFFYNRNAVSINRSLEDVLDLVPAQFHGEAGHRVVPFALLHLVVQVDGIDGDLGSML